HYDNVCTVKVIDQRSCPLAVSLHHPLCLHSTRWALLRFLPAPPPPHKSWTPFVPLTITICQPSQHSLVTLIPIHVHHMHRVPDICTTWSGRSSKWYESFLLSWSLSGELPRRFQH